MGIFSGIQFNKFIKLPNITHCVTNVNSIYIYRLKLKFFSDACDTNS